MFYLNIKLLTCVCNTYYVYYKHRFIVGTRILVKYEYMVRI